ncbi:hypothetical protein G6F31_020911 [Rhizopus arrhizus]|nr:hypothetical protein G6F31_020911 [Rhizopus arrhizus]
MFVIEIDVDYEKYLEEVFLYLVTADQQVDKKIKNRSLKYVVVENKLYRKIGRGSEARLVLVPKRGEREADVRELLVALGLSRRQGLCLHLLSVPNQLKCSS